MTFSKSDVFKHSAHF